MTEPHRSIAPPRRTLLAILTGGTVAAAAILVSAVLPAEFHIDPLGIGKATGLLKLSAPPEVQMSLPAVGDTAVARFYPVEFRADSVEIPLAAAGEDGSDLEWKVRMRTGETLLYSWTTIASAEEFYVDFHGQTDPQPEVRVLTYKKGWGNADNGAMRAQFDGIHGWYLQNNSEHPVVVRLRLSGFYEMRANPSASE